MSAAAQRRARLLRLRTIEHRSAAIRLAAADAARDAVANVSDRVARLLGGISVGEGQFRGHDLQSLAELSDRLGRAQAGLAESLGRAEAVRDMRQAERIAAHVAEERTGRVHADASRREAVERDLRAAAARPPRTRASGARI
jgi:hypothetical protein